MTSITIRIADYTPLSKSWLLELNQSNLPEVGTLSDTDLDTLIPQQHALRVAYAGNQRAGAIFLMQPGQPYQSSNYLWFCAQGEPFLYVDRVMVDKAFRGSGIGFALYQDAEIIAQRTGAARITCEVNTDPPNPGSLAFHKKLGFRELLERDSGQGKRVMMMEKRLKLS